MRVHRNVLVEILDVQQRETAGVEPEIVQRVDSGVGGPEDIHFHFQELRVAAREHDVVTGGVIDAGNSWKCAW